MVGTSNLLSMCFVVAMAVAAPLSDLVLLQMSAESTASRSPALSDEGYQLVAAQKNDTLMSMFIKRVLKSEGWISKDDGALRGFVPFYSGMEAVQNYTFLEKELRRASWVDHGIGRTANLTDEGYQLVAAQHDVGDFANLEASSFTVMSGTCIASGLCVQSPNYPGVYNILDECSINVKVGIELTVDSFVTYNDYDDLFVNGIKYHGEFQPENRNDYKGGTTTQSTITWTTANSNCHGDTAAMKLRCGGWKICDGGQLAAPSASGDPHLTNFRGDKFDIKDGGGVQW